MIVSIHQPAYLPWLGYIDRIAASDVFVFLDTVQFEKNSFINRNRIKTGNGPLWLTIPVLQTDHIRRKLIDIEIDHSRPWQMKHLRSIEQNYRRARKFDQYLPKLQTLFADTHTHLAELCFDQLVFWLRELNVATRVVRASQLPVSGTKSELILNICKHLDATVYLSGPNGRDYLDEETFHRSGVRIEYHDYDHPTYTQLHGEFLPAMSVIDYWLNSGDTETFRTTGAIS